MQNVEAAGEPVAPRIAASLQAALGLWAQLAADAGFSETMRAICETCIAALAEGRKILTIGNGGSATDAMHLAEELVGRFSRNRQPFPALCLATDTSALTCIANDFDFDQVFVRPVRAFCQPGDVLIAFSTGGESPNIVKALQQANQQGGITIGFLGKTGGSARALCRHAVVVPHHDTARIQELHTFCLHLICDAIEHSDLSQFEDAPRA